MTDNEPKASTPLSPEEVNEAVAKRLGFDLLYPQFGKDAGKVILVDSEGKPSVFPDYCGKIGAAFEMLDQLEWSLSKQPDGIYCWLNRDGRIVKEIADTAPMAICLSFLKLP